MAIVQISKIQQRSGNLVDLPQLDEAEFGWASDAKRLFIGKTTPNENVEILTSYSTIDFSQINGVIGNININPITIAADQVLAFDGSDWVNRGGNAGGVINLGDVSNVKITGGAIGYVLETDGIGNLSWTPKSTIIAYIENVTLGNGAAGNLTTVTTTQDNFFIEGAEVTITDVTGTTQLNGNSYYIGVETSNSFSLYTDAGLTTGLNATGYGAFPYATVSATDTTTDYITVSNSAPFTANAPVVFGGNVDTANTDIIVGQTYYVKNKDPSGNTWITISQTVGGTTFSPRTKSGLTGFVYITGGRIISAVGGGSGTASAGGAQNSVQYNNSNLLDGDTNFTWDFANTLLTVNGNANVGNINASGVITTTRFISNVLTGTAPPLAVSSTDRVANLNVSYANVSDFEVVTAQTTGIYYPVFVNSSSTGNRALGANANLAFNVATGNLSVQLLSVTSNANIGNIGTGGLIVATGNITGANLNTVGIANVGANANIGGNLNVTANANITANLSANNGAVGNLLTVGANANVTGNLNVTTNAVITANLSANNGAIGNLLSVGANANVTGNLNVTTNAVITANLSANNGAIGNALTVGANANVGNLGTAGLVVATGNVTGGNLVTGGALSVTGNANVGNLGTGRVIATGNISGTQLISNIATGTAPLVVTSTTTVANLAATSATTAGTVTTAAQPNITSVGTLTSLAVTGNISAGNVSATTFTGALSGAATSATTAGTVTTAAQPNITSVGTLTSLSVTGNISAGNISATTFTGALTGAASTAGTVTTAAQPNITSTGTLTSLAVTGNISAGNVSATTFTGALSGAATTAGTVTTAAQPNITSVGTLTSLGVSGALTTTQLTAGANTTAGNITGNWTLTAGSRLTATYADLAEYYEADERYLPGTVLMFGGEKEVTLADDGTSRVAGVVSTNPAYVMNATCPGLLTAVALQGRVPCKVRGKISKGDMLISGGNGFARPNQFPTMGTVIGKALEDFDGYEGVIEVAVGRL